MSGGVLTRNWSALRDENGRLSNELDASMCAGKRQGAPFSRGKRKDNPKPYGRKSCKAHGRRHQRQFRIM